MKSIGKLKENLKSVQPDFLISSFKMSKADRMKWNSQYTNYSVVRRDVYDRSK